MMNSHPIQTHKVEGLCYRCGLNKIRLDTTFSKLRNSMKELRGTLDTLQGSREHKRPTDPAKGDNERNIL